MRITTALPLALPLLASAQQQIPFIDSAKNLLAQAQGFLAGGSNNAASVAAKASASVSSASSAAVNAASGAARPVTSAISNAAVHELTLDNWKSTFVHSGSAKAGSPSEPWFVGTTGGKKTCGDMCGKFDEAWDEAVTVLSADPTGPQFAHLNCDDQEILCGVWSAAACQVWVYQIPHPTADQSPAPIPLSIFPMNYSAVVAQDIISIHTEKQYLTSTNYEGAFHPFDGWLAKAGLTLPMAYFLYGMAKIPSWAFMISLSLLSRYWVSKRVPNGAPPFARPAPGNAAAPAAAPAR